MCVVLGFMLAVVVIVVAVFAIAAGLYALARIKLRALLREGRK